MLIVIHIVLKYAWAMQIGKKYGTPLTNGFNTIIEEGRTSENLWIDRGIGFYNRTSKPSLKEHRSNFNIQWFKSFFIERLSWMFLPKSKNQRLFVMMATG